MKISKLSLVNFRNRKSASFSFSPETTIIIGKNASGKTNIIEAIYFLVTGKSFRVGRDLSAIAFSEESARIKGEITDDRDRKTLELMLSIGTVTGIKTPLKRFLVNGIARRSIDFAGNLKAVLFWPEDMELVTDSPSLRRRYLDFVLMQTDREYRRTLISYERGLRQRNKLLEAIRDNNANSLQLFFWNQLLIKQGNYISGMREKYIDFVNGFVLPDLDKSGISYSLTYDKSVISQLRLEQYGREEIAAGVTLVGPHRDNMIFRFRESGMVSENPDYADLSVFGSRGEQRLGVLWLKLAEMAYLEKLSGAKPVLLLDDIFSELDHEHREIIFKFIGEAQSILTVTDRHLIPSKYLNPGKVIELDKDSLG